ncbi:hypothetical protein LTR66_017650, partial [Elasticomyces elasticus]
MTLGGSVTHGGGSCQLSLSYDNGKSFHVITSIIGGCPLKDTWNFTIPANSPSADSALFAWSWFNLEGNREMYMNCARVQITGNNTAPIQRRLTKNRRRTNQASVAVADLPDNFACNIGNGCTTIEDQSVVFPNPGVVVEIDPVVNLKLAGYSLTGPTPTGNSFLTGSLVPTSSGSLTTTSTYSPPASASYSATSGSSLTSTATTGAIIAAISSGTTAMTGALTSPSVLTSSIVVTNTLTSGTTTITLTNDPFPTETIVPGVSGLATIVSPVSATSSAQFVYNQTSS